MANHLQNVIPDWSPLSHLRVKECLHGHLPAGTILLPKHLFEVHHHVVGSHHGLMLVLQHIGHRSQYVTPSHLVSLEPSLIGLHFLFRGVAIWLRRAHICQHELVPLSS